MENKPQIFWKVFAIFMIVLNMLILAFVILQPSKNRERDAGPYKYIVEKLALSNSQIIQFDALVKDHRKIMKDLSNSGKQLREEFFQDLELDSSSIKTENLAAEIAENQKEIELVTFHHFQALKEICTAEQKIIFKEIIADVTKKMSPKNPQMPKPKK